MARPLPRLRTNLDLMPSPVEDRPGLLIRDPYHYSDATLIVPPLLAACLEYFDGQQTELDLSAALVRMTGELQVSDVVEHLVGTLDSAGFLETRTYQELREARQKEFAGSEVREAAHAGGGYPAAADELAAVIGRYMEGAAPAPAAPGKLAGVAAPHVSPEGGWQSYRAAYSALDDSLREKTFVVLGTSHYGMPDRFGLTRKRFRTPWGDTRTGAALVDELERRAGPAVLMEDYCHAVEHSIEFQVVFLQSRFGPDVRVLPILCGSFARALMEGAPPERDENVRRFLDVLGDIAAREADRLFWVLGVDMAHMGRRYGDPFAAHAMRGEMLDVAGRDRARMERLSAGDAEGYWNLVLPNHDDLKWCGSSPFYTFLRTVPGLRGSLAHYEQWNIDAQSVVSFAGMHFRRE